MRNKAKSLLNNEVLKGADFFTVEAYKVARTNIVLSLPKSDCKVLVVTSSQSNEGKTTSCCNIAVALSQQVNCRVLVIDCDLRLPSVGKFFKLKNAHGLTQYLGGVDTIEQIVQKIPNTNLSVICSGLIPPNPSELLASDSMENLVKDLMKDYDYILLDSPPIGMVVDALPLVKIADGTIIVAYEGVSSYADMDKTVDVLKRYDAKILGFVLNGSKSDRHHYSYYKYSYYR